MVAVRGGLAYVLSTGHLFVTAPAEPVVEFFHGVGGRCEWPFAVKGAVVASVDDGQHGIDFSVIEAPCVDPTCRLVAVPVAEAVPFRPGLVSVGCDGGQPPTACGAEAVRWHTRRRDFYVRFAGGGEARPGRSGGGLFCDGELVGVCWGRCLGRNPSGCPGAAVFVGCNTIAKVMRTLGFGRLLGRAADSPTTPTDR